MAKTGIQVKYQGKKRTPTFHKKLFVKHQEKHSQQIRESLQTHGKEVKKELKKVISTSVGNGRHYSGLPNRSSSEGQAPVSQSGRLENSFIYRTTPMFLKIASKEKHAKFLELGTRKMGVRPYFQCTIESMHYQLEKDLKDATRGPFGKWLRTLFK